MNILITGGTGFIGSRLANAFIKDRHHVYILSRSSATSEHPYMHYIEYSMDNINQLSGLRSCRKISTLFTTSQVPL